MAVVWDSSGTPVQTHPPSAASGLTAENPPLLAVGGCAQEQSLPRRNLIPLSSRGHGDGHSYAASLTALGLAALRSGDTPKVTQRAGLECYETVSQCQRTV